MASKGQRMIFEDEYQYLKDVKKNYPDPTDIGGDSYTAGDGINISDSNVISVDSHVLVTDNQGNLNQPLTTNNYNGYSVKYTYGADTYTSKFSYDKVQVVEPYYTASYGTTRIDYVLDQFNDQHYPTININAGQPGQTAITHITIPHNPTAGTTVDYTLATTDDIPTVTNSITQGSTDAVTSGAVYDVIGNIETLLAAI